MAEWGPTTSSPQVHKRVLGGKDNLFSMLTGTERDVHRESALRKSLLMVMIAMHCTTLGDRGGLAVGTLWLINVQLEWGWHNCHRRGMDYHASGSPFQPWIPRTTHMPLSTWLHQNASFSHHWRASAPQLNSRFGRMGEISRRFCHGLSLIADRPAENTTETRFSKKFVLLMVRTRWSGPEYGNMSWSLRCAHLEDQKWLCSHYATYYKLARASH